MKLRRIMIAAVRSGSGKTMLTCALLQILKERGEQAVAFKCGPDYIDPMFHETVLGVPSKNLDTFFTGKDGTKEIFSYQRREEEFVVMEGVMGLFDGLGGIREEGSSYQLAEVTKTPIILVVDAKGMGRSLIAQLSGFLSYDTEKLIRGVILNRMSKAYYEVISPLVEKELGLCVLGYVPEEKDLKVESRHLGLIMPGEMEGIRERIGKQAEKLEETVSIKRIFEIAEGAEELEAGENQKMDCAGQKECSVIAVAKDEAFCFYYEDNLRLLREMGAELVFFSPLHDTGLPIRCNGILLGGGYPENYAKELSENTKLHKEIRCAFEKGMPIVAECGGFMYLHKELIWEGKGYPMVGVLSASCYTADRLIRFGYVEIEERRSLFLPQGERIRGHEFHYFDSTDNGEDCLAIKPVSGRSYPCIKEKEHCFLGFPHLYYPSNPEFARRFVEKAKKYSGQIQPL